MMTITYTDDAGKERKMLYDEDNARWSGDDVELALLINENLIGFIGRYEYFPHVWYRVKAVADALDGSLDTPEPVLEPNPPGSIE